MTKLSSIVTDTISKTTSATNEGTHKLLFGAPEWVGYTFGSIFIVLGLAIFAYYPKAKRNADHYRTRQLAEYNKQNNKSVKYYKQTGMFLPAWEKTKMFAPILFGLVFIVMGIAWIAGQTLFTM